MSWNDFGLGLDDDARRQAMRQAIMDAGIAIMQRAPTEGWGALAAGGPAFFGGYRDHLKEADQRRRQLQEDELNEQYRRERLESLRQTQEDRLERRGDRDEAKQARVDELVRQRELVGLIADPNKKKIGELLVGSEYFDNWYAKNGGPPEPAEPPDTKTYPDGSLRAWDPETRDYSRVLGRKPPKEDDDETGLLDDATRSRLKGGLEASEDARKVALKRADDEIAKITEDNALRAKSNETAEEGAKVALKAVPDRLTLARKYEEEELPAARYRLGIPAPAAPGRATRPQEPRSLPKVGPTAPAPQKAGATPVPPAATPAKAPGQATPEQAQQLAALIEQRVAAYGKPPAEAMAIKAQILARARKALADGVPADVILRELQGPQ